MKNLEGIFNFTKEALYSGESFFRELKAEGERQKINSLSLQEICESLEEHLSFALREELDKRRITLVDAQLMTELICSLGSPEEILEGLPKDDSEFVKSPMACTAVDVHQETPTETANGKIEHTTDYFNRFRKKQLCRSTKNTWLFGICGGLGEYFGIPPIILRLIFIFPPLFPMSILFFYIPLIFLLPLDTDSVSNNRMQRAEGCLIRGLRYSFSLFMAIIVYFPLAIVSILFAGTGFIKILFESGLTQEYYLFANLMNFPGFLSGTLNIIIGLSFCALFSHLMIASISGRAILTINTKNLLLFAAISGIIVQSLLLLAAKTQTWSKSNTSEKFSFNASLIREIYIEDKVLYPRLNKNLIEITGDPDTATITIDIVREARGKNTSDAEEALQSISVLPVIESGVLTIPLLVNASEWWFYKYPEVRITVRIPDKQTIAIKTVGKFINGNLRIRRLNSSLSLNNDILSAGLEDISSSDLNISNNIGSIEMNNINADKLKLISNIGSFDIRNSKGSSAIIETNIGSVEMKNIEYDNLKIETQMGQIILDDYYGRRLKGHSDLGTIQARINRCGPDSEYILTSNIGQVELILPEDASPEYSLQNNLGHIENDFENTSPAVGSPKVTLKSSLGQLSLITSETRSRRKKFNRQDKMQIKTNIKNKLISPEKPYQFDKSASEPGQF
ncbi:MAG: DUF4097 family beta strand repeat protein [Candidatus Riflebacteria bacterium]|nr:DUF4097 family beta strand repeat protein [Candidatus Riflebacteria bacterium]